MSEAESQRHADYDRVPGIRGHLVAAVAAAAFGSTFGLFLASLASVVFSGTTWLGAFGNVSMALAASLLVFGYPQPFFRHSIWSRILGAIAFALGIGCWLWYANIL